MWFMKLITYLFLYHSKAPVNSPLSFIRQQKVPQRNRSSISTPSSLGSPSSVNLLSPPSSSIEISTTCSTEKTTNSTQQRPPMFAHSSADLLTNLAPSPTKRPLDRGRRPRKVSFNENVMVICTRFDGDEDDKDTYDTDDDTTDNGQTNSRLIYQGRRHSTGEHIMVDRRQRKGWLTFVEILKQWPSSSSAT